METFGKETPLKLVHSLKNEIKRHFTETYQKLDYISENEDQLERFGYPLALIEDIKEKIHKIDAFFRFPGA